MASVNICMVISADAAFLIVAFHFSMTSIVNFVAMLKKAELTSASSSNVFFCLLALKFVHPWTQNRTNVNEVTFSKLLYLGGWTGGPGVRG